MYRYQFKPETYKERAEQFLKVGKRQRALETLYDAIKNSRKQKQWSQAFEDTMSLYVRLCVDLRDSQMAKDGLHQFRNVSTNTSPQSLEKIVRLYLTLSAKKCEEAKQDAERQAVDDVEAVDDLDNAETPEMLLSQVHHEDKQGRQNRVTLQPWLRFQWEAYRSCIDLLKAHNKYEAMYHDIALKAFEFVLAYDRRNEFRRLCETLRGHYEQWKMKRDTPGTGVDINNQETIELNLRTRLQQLKVAIQMQLWQEAYRAIDDINTFLAELKIRQGATKEFRQKFTHRLSEFYENCAFVFKKAQVHIFHAAALNRRFAMQRSTAQKALVDPENTKVVAEITKLASQLTVASLAVPLQPETEEIDQHLLYDDAKQRKMREMSRLLQLKFLPTRNLLLEELSRNGALEHARPEIQKLYQCMENEFDPQHTCQKIDAIFRQMEAGENMSDYYRDMYREYLPQLRDVTVSIMLHELSQVYESITIDSVVALVPWATRDEIERVAIMAASETDLDVYIDHSGSGYFVFGSDITMASTSTTAHVSGSFGHAAAAANDNSSGAASKAYLGKEDRLSNHLVSVYYNLTATVNALDLISHNVLHSALRATAERQLKLFKEREKQTQMDALQRKDLIKQRYIELDESDKRSKLRKDEEAKETREEKKKREEERLKVERDAVEKQKTKQQVEADAEKIFVARRDIIRTAIAGFVGKVPDAEMMLEKVDELKTLADVEKFERDRRQEMEKEAREKDLKILAVEKRNDYFMRACYIEEARVRPNDNVKTQELRGEHWKEQESFRLEEAQQLREMASKRKQRLLRMKKYKDEFANEIKQRLQQDYKQRLESWVVEYDSELQKRLELRRQERKRQRQEDWKQKQQEERDRKNEEIAKQRREEEEATRLAELTKNKERLESVRRGQDEATRKQNEKQEEVMRKQQAKEAGSVRPNAANDGGIRQQQRTMVPPAGGGGGGGRSMFGQNMAAGGDVKNFAASDNVRAAAGGGPRRDSNDNAAISRSDFGQRAPLTAPASTATKLPDRSEPAERPRIVLAAREPRYAPPEAAAAHGADTQHRRSQYPDRPQASGGAEFSRDQMGTAAAGSDRPQPSSFQRPDRAFQGGSRQDGAPRHAAAGSDAGFSRDMMGQTAPNGNAHPVNDRTSQNAPRRDDRGGPRRVDDTRRPPQQQAAEGGRSWR